MVTKQDGKKKWVVRLYTDSHNGSYLEEALNTLFEDGYTLYQINHERSQVIGYLKEESGFLKLLSPSRKDEEEKDEVDDDPLLTFKSSNPMTNPLLANLLPIMEARSAGDPHTEIRVTNLIEHTMKRSSLNYAHGAADDLLQLLSLHKAHVTRISDDKRPCTDSCSVNVVLGMAAAKLHAFLAKHPMS